MSICIAVISAESFSQVPVPFSSIVINCFYATHNTVSCEMISTRVNLELQGQS